ncbi:hypothetical protein PRUB_b0158 [Pseudoalteromonas rubra]|uniref:Uncharacterized protein n=1 Tax=Pseudoalteromonas rubra TaxID=43658 RepID=A0A8T0C1D2_9GAMM|nr:hypothetical protein [Pseudoalteromonas rubra]KAF7781058.1 hypothetical protein PRUB_b0158 [Pseudoalteromonas rubra]
MLYIILTIALLALSALLFTPSFKAFTLRYEVACNFILTLVATLVGVLLAIAISNYDADKKEIKDLIKVLYAAEAVVEESLDYSVKLNEIYQENPEQFGKQGDFFARNPLVYPHYLDNMLTQNLISKNLSQEGLSELNEHLITLQRSKQVAPQAFIASMRYIQQVLILERRFQLREISAQEYQQALDAHEEQLVYQQQKAKIIKPAMRL